MASSPSNDKFQPPASSFSVLQEYPWLKETQQEEEQVQCWSDGAQEVHSQRRLGRNRQNRSWYSQPLGEARGRGNSMLSPGRAGTRRELSPLDMWGALGKPLCCHHPPQRCLIEPLLMLQRCRRAASKSRLKDVFNGFLSRAKCVLLGGKGADLQCRGRKPQCPQNQPLPGPQLSPCLWL